MVTALPNRRQFLSAGLAAAVTATAGCLDVLGGESDPRRVLQLELSREDGPLRDRYVVDLAERRPEWSEDAFEAALDGTAYTTQYRRPFFSTPNDPKYALREGTYYRLGSVVVDEASMTRPVLRLSEVGDGDATPDGVPTDRLPEADQHAVEIAWMAARAREDDGGVPRGLVQRGGYVYRREDAIAESRLLSEDAPEHLTFRDTRYAVAVSRERFHEPVYRPTVEPVAESPERMEAILRAKFVTARLSREDLSQEAEDVLRDARTDGYAESHPYSPAYRAVLRAMNERAYVDGDVRSDAFTDEHGRGTLLYDGEYYEYWLQFRSVDVGE